MEFKSHYRLQTLSAHFPSNFIKYPGVYYFGTHWQILEEFNSKN